MTLLLIIIVLVIFFSAVFSGTEAALLSFPRNRITILRRSNKRRHRRVVRLYDNLSQTITTIVVLNNLANIAGSLYVGSLAAELLNSAEIGILSGVLTFLLIVFSEVIPKTVGEHYSQKLVPWIAPPAIVAHIILFPIVWILTAITKLFTRGRRPSLNTSENEIRLMALKGRREGTIEEDEARMVQRIFRLNDVTARDLMTPRNRIETLSQDMPVGDASKLLATTPYSRILVIGKDTDDVRGVVMTEELLIQLAHDEHDHLIGDFMRSALFVESHESADDLLRTFQKEKHHLAVVQSADDRTLGVVTLEDVLEEIVGDIEDESDPA